LTTVPPKRVWIDLDNTPHVPFFQPIIRELERAGHTVVVTARDAFQVCSLADHHGVAHTTIGRHYGANRFLKVAGTVWRAAELLPFVIRQKPDISMSHGSRPLVIVSGLLRIPTMLLFDYEHATRIPVLKPALGVAPSSIDGSRLSGSFRYGVRSYAGLKEDVYAAGFRPDPSLPAALGVDDREILVTIRPPATEAHYHNPEAEELFTEVVDMLGRTEGVRMVILPRTAGAQRDFVLRTWPDWCASRKIVLPDGPLDGLNLVWHSDLVVSGGGTMNREAAALGVPVYSIFRGKLGAVDRYLAQEGRLVLLATRDEVRAKIRVEKRSRAEPASPADRPALRQILEAANELMELSDGRR
jgi:predicted glycosyltransferase